MSIDLSRVENILETMLGRSEIKEPAQSRVEELLIELKEAIEEGGTGGDITALTARIAKCERDISSIETVDETQTQQIQSIVTTLGEFRTAIENLDTDVSNKVDKEAGKGLSTNDFTDTEKTKLDNHVVDTNNPHQVTKAQIGLGNVDNVATKDVLAELVDAGAKNKLNHTAYTRTVNGVTFTINADRSITITSDGTNTQSLLYLVQNYTGVPAGNYVLSGCPSGSFTTFDLRVKVGSTTYTNYSGGTEFTYNGTDTFESTIVVRASQTLNITMYPMICTKAAWDASHAYVPHRPSYDELVARIEALERAGE